jgi:trk system potassium uptake protein TrkA
VWVDEVVLPEHEAGVRLGRRLSAINFVDFMELSDDMVVVEVVTPPQFANKSLKETNIRQQYGLTVVAIKRDQQVVVSPRADEIMKPEDILVILGTAIVTSAVTRLNGPQKTGRRHGLPVF